MDHEVVKPSASAVPASPGPRPRGGRHFLGRRPTTPSSIRKKLRMLNMRSPASKAARALGKSPLHGLSASSAQSASQPTIVVPTLFVPTLPKSKSAPSDCEMPSAVASTAASAMAAATSAANATTAYQSTLDPPMAPDDASPALSEAPNEPTSSSAPTENKSTFKVLPPPPSPWNIAAPLPQVVSGCRITRAASAANAHNLQRVRDHSLAV